MLKTHQLHRQRRGLARRVRACRRRTNLGRCRRRLLARTRQRVRTEVASGRSTVILLEQRAQQLQLQSQRGRRRQRHPRQRRRRPRHRQAPALRRRHLAAATAGCGGQAVPRGGRQPSPQQQLKCQPTRRGLRSRLATALPQTRRRRRGAARRQRKGRSVRCTSPSRARRRRRRG